MYIPVWHGLVRLTDNRDGDSVGRELVGERLLVAPIVPVAVLDGSKHLLPVLRNCASAVNTGPSSTRLYTSEVFLILTISRRQFVEGAVALAASVCPAASVTTGQEQTDPFESLPETVWKNSRSNGLIMIHRPAPAPICSCVQIAHNSEPGKRLVVHGRVFAPDGQTAIQGITVYAYNTDAAGYYGPDQKEYPPRLYGWMRTDAAGRFELRTIYPGHYPGMHVPAHVHFTLWGPGYPPQWAEELRFRGDPYITDEMLANAVEQGEFSSIQPLTATNDGVLQCRYKLKLLSEANFR